MKYRNYALIIIIAICIILYINKDNSQTKSINEYTQISQSVAKEMMDTENVVILDVREESEYIDGHIENSILLPLGEVESRAEVVLPNKDEKILVYCRSGNRSKQASTILVDMGYTNVYEFGGVNTWQYGLIK